MPHAFVLQKEKSIPRWAKLGLPGQPGTEARLTLRWATATMHPRLLSLDPPFQPAWEVREPPGVGQGSGPLLGMGKSL